MKIKVLQATVRRCAGFSDHVTSNPSESRVIRSRSLRDLDIPDHTIFFFFYDLAEIKVQFGRHIVTWSKPIPGSESSPYYYGEVYTWARLHQEFPDERSILAPGDSACALHSMGRWQILDPGDRVVSPTTRKVTVVR